jgi:hypothetical protein
MAIPPSLALWLLSSAVSETLRSVAATSNWFLPWVRSKTLASIGPLADRAGPAGVDQRGGRPGRGDQRLEFGDLGGGAVEQQRVARAGGAIGADLVRELGRRGPAAPRWPRRAVLPLTARVNVELGVRVAGADLVRGRRRAAGGAAIGDARPRCCCQTSHICCAPWEP